MFFTLDGLHLCIMYSLCIPFKVIRDVCKMVRWLEFVELKVDSCQKIYKGTIV